MLSIHNIYSEIISLLMCLLIRLNFFILPFCNCFFFYFNFFIRIDIETIFFRRNRRRWNFCLIFFHMKINKLREICWFLTKFLTTFVSFFFFTSFITNSKSKLKNFDNEKIYDKIHSNMKKKTVRTDKNPATEKQKQKI